MVLFSAVEATMIAEPQMLSAIVLEVAFVVGTVEPDDRIGGVKTGSDGVILNEVVC